MPPWPFAPRLPLDQDDYDAANWSAFPPLSERSVAQYGEPAEAPDFPQGAWEKTMLMAFALAPIRA